MHIGKSKAEMTNLYLKETTGNAFLNREDVIPRLLTLPVCPRCERPMLKDRGWTAKGVAQCVNERCGWRGPVDKTYDVEIHLMDGGG